MKLGDIEIEHLIEALLDEEQGLRRDQRSASEMAINPELMVSFYAAAETIGSLARALRRANNFRP